VEGSTGDVPAQVATSLALLTAELVHNAIEHGIGPGGSGTVTVTLRRLQDEIKVVVRDDGKGLPEGFHPEDDANLGLAIVKTVVEDDLKGTLAFTSARGTVVTVRVPVPGPAGLTEQS
jgi:two-component sensor histidine kinase